MRGKNKLLIGICLLTGLAARAQVSLVIQVPPTGVMQKNQLWNLAIVYGGNSTAAVSVQLTLVDVRNGQPVLTAVTRPLFLMKGTNPITAKDVAPVQYDYLSPLFSDRDPNGFLPVGNYKACYTVLQTLHGSQPAAEDCIPLEVQPLSPPQLNTPADTATVQTAYPQFSWLPPTPINLFSDLSYDMILVEVLPGQGAYQAIQQNIPVYNSSHLQDPVNLYPASAKPLDTGRLYAWRVLAMNEDQFITQSEVWTFKLATPQPKALMVPGGNYIPLRSTAERAAGLQVLKSDTIGIKYYCFERDHTDTIRFYGTDGKLVKAVQERIRYGENFLVFVLDGAFSRGTVYRAEMTDSRKNRYTASFLIK